MNGLNLGGWLILEKWMTPSVFGGLQATDEYSLCIELGEKRTDLFKSHRENFITKKDIEWIAAHGFNAVRLPIPHWVFGGFDPYEECEEYVHKLLDWAEAYEIKVVLDLHSAPGSQNGHDHSGRSGHIGWHLDEDNISRTVELISKIAKVFGTHKSVAGIELLNEPSREIPFSWLNDFYARGYEAVRTYCDESVAVIISDAYRPIVEWEEFINNSDYKNILLDLHLYQVFSGKDKSLSFEDHLGKVFKWQKMLEAFGPSKTIVGEWSAALHGVYDQLNLQKSQEAEKLYLKTQQLAFSKTAGHFYWNYKTEHNNSWNYRYLA